MMMGHLAAVSHIRLAEPLDGECGIADFVGVPPRPKWEYTCTYNNPLSSLTCSFDGEESVECSFPVFLNRDLSGPGPHSVMLTATDVFGQTFRIRLGVRGKQEFFLPTFV